MATIHGASGSTRGGPAGSYGAAVRPRASNPITQAWTNQVRTFTQLPAGLIQSTVANTSLPTDRQRPWYARNPLQYLGAAVTGDPNYRPAIVDQVPALVGVAQALYNRRRLQADPQAAQDFMRTIPGMALNRIDAGNQRVNRSLGIQDPANPLELALNIAGGVMVPGGPAFKSTAPTRMGRFLRTTAMAPVEMALPLRQTSLPVALGVTETAGLGLSEVLDTEHSGYTGLSEMVQGGDNPQHSEHPALAAMNAPLGQDQPQTDVLSAMNAPLGLQDDTSDPVLSAMNAPLQPEIAQSAISRTPEDDAEDEESWLNWRNAAIGIGGVLSVVVGRRLARNIAREAPENLVREGADLPELRGIEFRNSRQPGNRVRIPGTSKTIPVPGLGAARGVARRRTADVVQQDQPIRDFARDFMGPQYAARQNYQLDRLTNVSIGARVQDLLTTGRFRGHRYTRMTPMLEAYGKELSPHQQQYIDDAILAARGLDDREAFESAPSFTNMSDDVLRQIIGRVQRDPVMSKYFNFAMRVARDQRDFMVRNGLITQEVADRWARLRPHWTPFNRSVIHDADMNSLLEREFTANKNAVSAQSGTTDASSVQAGATGNPFVGLIDRWSNLVRMVEMNDVRGKFLNDAAGLGQNPATGRPWVRRNPANARALDPQTHIVFENGTRRAYYVEDPSLSRSLDFSPRATAGAMEGARRIMQGLVTGPLATAANLFAIAKSPMYDATLGMILRKPGMTLGTLNEIMLALTKGKVHMGPLDPTIMAGGPIGAVRYMWDGIKRDIGTTLETELLKENSWLRDAIGQQNLGKMATLFSNAHENSIRSLMDQLGISSHTMHGSPDPARTITHLQDIAPSFADATAAQIYQSTLKAGPGPYRRVLAGSQNTFARVRSSAIARAYSGVVEAMHNGFRYQALATAKRKSGFDQRIAQTASELRRLSGDAAQHGGNDTINKVTGSFMYSNLTLQVLHEVGMMVRKNPGTFALNIATFVPTIMALHYLAMATDEEAREQHLNKSPEQRAASVTTFSGAEIPIDPFVRLILSPQMTLFDNLTGVNDGQVNPDLLHAFSQQLDGTEREDQWHEIETAFWSNMRANNPLDPFGNPAAAGVFAYAGADPGMTRFSGEVTGPRLQDISGADQDSTQTDALTSAYWENFIRATTGVFGGTIFNMANDTVRASRGGASNDEAFTRGLERWQETLERGAGPYRPLFGNYEHLINVGDGNWQQYNERRQGIDSALRVYNTDVRTSNTTSMSYPMPLPTDVPLPNFQGTQAALIGAEALMLDRETAFQRRRLAQLGDQADAIRNRYVTPREQNNRELNENTRQRRAISLWLLMRTREREERVSRMIGQDFTFEDYNPRDYMTPVQPQPTATGTTVP